MSPTAVLDPFATRILPDNLFLQPDGGRWLELVDVGIQELNASVLSSYLVGKFTSYFNLMLGSRIFFGSYRADNRSAVSATPIAFAEVAAQPR